MTLSTSQLQSRSLPSTAARKFPSSLPSFFSLSRSSPLLFLSLPPQSPGSLTGGWLFYKSKQARHKAMWARKWFVIEDTFLVCC